MRPQENLVGEGGVFGPWGQAYHLQEWGQRQQSGLNERACPQSTPLLMGHLYPTLASHPGVSRASMPACHPHDIFCAAGGYVTWKGLFEAEGKKVC